VRNVTGQYVAVGSRLSRAAAKLRGGPPFAEGGDRMSSVADEFLY
jgi:hypothetical protein